GVRKMPRCGCAVLMDRGDPLPHRCHPGREPGFSNRQRQRIYPNRCNMLAAVSRRTSAGDAAEAFCAKGVKIRLGLGEIDYGGAECETGETALPGALTVSAARWRRSFSPELFDDRRSGQTFPRHR